MRKSLLALGLFLVLLPVAGVAGQQMELTLEQSVHIALQRSKSLAVARAKVEEAEAGVAEARTGFLPKLSTNLSYTRLDMTNYIDMAEMGEAMNEFFGPIYDALKITPPTTGGEAQKIYIGDDDLYNSSLTLQQPLFTGFRVWNSYKLASYNAQAEEHNYRKAEADLILDVIKAYYGLLKAQQFEAVSAQSVEQMEAHVADLENMYQAGMVARNNLLKAQVQLSNVKIMHLKARNGVRLARVALCNAMGIPLDTEITLKTELKYEPVMAIELEEALQQALENRPELRTMQARLRMGQKAVSLARANWLPNLLLVGNYNYKRPNRENEPKFYSSWDISLAVQLNIWDWGQVRHQVAQARYQLQQMEESFGQLQDGVALEVTQNYLALKEKEEEIAATRENVVQAEENYRVTQEKFHQGMATNTDLLDANTLLTQARMDHVNALADYHIAKAQLERAMGTLKPSRFANPREEEK